MEKQLVIMLLVLKVESINTLVHVEQPPVNFQYTYIIVPKKKKCLKEPYIQLNIMMKLTDSQQFEFYENLFHKIGYDKLNYPEYFEKV